MKNKSIKAKVLTGALITTLMISCAATAFATPTNTENLPNTTTPCSQDFTMDKKSKMSLKRQQHEAEKQAVLENTLSTLVTDNTLSQDQADKIKETITQQQNDKKAEIEKLKTMSETDRKAYMKENHKRKVDFLKVLVDNGTITKEQASKVKDSLLKK